MPIDEGAVPTEVGSASEEVRPKRKVHRRTFDQIRAEERALFAGMLVAAAELARTGRYDLGQGSLFSGEAA